MLETRDHVLLPFVHICILKQKGSGNPSFRFRLSVFLSQNFANTANKTGTRNRVKQLQHVSNSQTFVVSRNMSNISCQIWSVALNKNGNPKVEVLLVVDIIYILGLRFDLPGLPCLSLGGFKQRRLGRERCPLEKLWFCSILELLIVSYEFLSCIFFVWNIYTNFHFQTPMVYIYYIVSILSHECVAMTSQRWCHVWVIGTVVPSLVPSVPLDFVSFLSRNPGDFLKKLFRPFCIKRPGCRTCRTILEK